VRETRGPEDVVRGHAPSAIVVTVQGHRLVRRVDREERHVVSEQSGGDLGRQREDPGPPGQVRHTARRPVRLVVPDRYGSSCQPAGWQRP
jgi:hypothetical protein